MKGVDISSCFVCKLLLFTVIKFHDIYNPICDLLCLFKLLKIVIHKLVKVKQKKIIISNHFHARK